MNKLDYPSLELCKKLADGFPEAEKCIWDSEGIYNYPASSFNIPGEEPIAYACPSTMEIFRKLPVNVNGNKLTIIRGLTGNCYVDYGNNNSVLHYFNSTTLPDSLAKMWLWLKEKDLLPK